MTFQDAVRAWVLSDATVAALVGERMEPLRTSQGVADSPRIEYSVVGRRRIGSLTRRRGLARLVIRFACKAVVKDDAQAVADAVQWVVDPTDGVLDQTVGEGEETWLIQHCRVVDGSEWDDHHAPGHDEGVGTYCVYFDVEFWYEEV